MYPFVFAAGAIALYFAVASLRRPRPAGILACALWAAYAVYEYFVANGTLCDPSCNIRVDLALFLPILGSATYLGLQKAPRAGAVATLCIVCLGLFALIAWVLGYNAVAAIAGGCGLIAAVYGIRLLFSRSPA